LGAISILQKSVECLREVLLGPRRLRPALLLFRKERKTEIRAFSSWDLGEHAVPSRGQQSGPIGVPLQIWVENLREFQTRILFRWETSRWGLDKKIKRGNVLQEHIRFLWNQL